jgi:hypothetical protein
MRELLSGVMPVAPTVFDDEENLDLEGQSELLDLARRERPFIFEWAGRA